MHHVRYRDYSLNLFVFINQWKAAYIYFVRHFYTLVEAAAGQDIKYVTAHDTA